MTLNLDKFVRELEFLLCMKYGDRMPENYHSIIMKVAKERLEQEYEMFDGEVDDFDYFENDVKESAINALGLD